MFQLKGSADRALDALDEPIGDWAHVRPGCRIPWRVKTLQVFADSRLPWLAAWAHASLFTALERSATLALALCHAHAISRSAALKDLQVSVLACRFIPQHMHVCMLSQAPGRTSNRATVKASDRWHAALLGTCRKLLYGIPSHAALSWCLGLLMIH